MFQIHKHFCARISLFGGNRIFLGAKLAAGRCDPLDRRRRNADRLSRLPASPLLSAATNPSGPRRDPKAAAHRPRSPAVAFRRVRRIERDGPTDQRTLADIGVDRDADGAALAAHGKRLCHGFFPIRPNCAQKNSKPAIMMVIRATDKAAPKGQLWPWPNCNPIRLPIIRFLPPPRIFGVTSAPRDGINVRIQPATIPGFTSGMMTSRSTRKGGA